MESRKVANMVWRQMGESVLYSLCIGALVTYLLMRYGLAGEFQGWGSAVPFILTTIGAMVVGGAAFGFMRSYPLRQRLRLLIETMLSLEKGNPIPPPRFSGGEDSADLTATDYTQSQSAKTGLYALEHADLFTLLCIPPDRRDGDTPAAVYQAAMRYFVDRRALLLVDPPKG